MAGEIPASKWEFPDIDRFGPFWSVLGCFGPFWENPRLSLRLRGHIPASSAAQGSCQRITSLSRLVRKRTKNGKIQNGPVGDRLGPFGPVWARGPYAPVCYAPVSGLLIHSPHSTTRLILAERLWKTWTQQAVPMTCRRRSP